MIQSKQSELATAPQTIIPRVTTVVPSTLAAALAPMLPPATALPVIGTTSSTGISISTETTTEKTTKLIKAMEEMSIQANELKKLREQVTSLETNCKLAQIQHKKETQRNRRMVERIKALEKDLTLQEPLGDMKEILWANIIDSINDVWPSIQIIFEQIELVQNGYRGNPQDRGRIGNKTEEAN